MILRDGNQIIDSKTESSKQTCMDCDAKEENNCVSTNISTKITECLTDNDKCFTFIDDNQVIRGCLADSDSFFQQTCLSDKQNCVLCAGTTCNNQTLTDKCLACDTRFNPECRNKSEREILCSIKVNENEFFGCYTSSFNNIVERGCIENLSLKERQACIDDPEHCKGCIGRNCNTDTVDDQLQCNFCNGSVDGNCANFGGTNTTRICQNGENACFVGIDKFGYTHRKCYAGDETDFKIFEICKRSNCNENIYPANRIKCYQCRATDDCLFYNPDKPNIPATPCQIYDEHDQCFAYVHRGNASSEVFFSSFILIDFCFSYLESISWLLERSD